MDGLCKKAVFHFMNEITAELCAEDFENAIDRTQEDRGTRNGYFLLKNNRLYRFVEVLKVLGTSKQGTEFKPKGYVADYAKQLKQIGIDLLKRGSVLNTKFLVARDTLSEDGNLVLPAPKRTVSGLLFADFGTALYKGSISFSNAGFGLHGISPSNPESGLILILASDMWKENDLIYAFPAKSFDRLFGEMRKTSTELFADLEATPFIESFPFDEYADRAGNYEDRMVFKLARFILQGDRLAKCSLTRYDVFFFPCSFSNAFRISKELHNDYRLRWCCFDDHCVSEKESMVLELIFEDSRYIRILISSNGHLEVLHELIRRSAGIDEDYGHVFIRNGLKLRNEYYLKLFEVFGGDCEVVEYRSKHSSKFRVKVKYAGRQTNEDSRHFSCLEMKGLELDAVDIDFILNDL